jgi:predicted RNase H-like HicB family nuclease
MVAVVALVHGVPGAYGVSFPDFPGCIAGGESVDEALRRGRGALKFHMDSMIEVGEPLPKIRGIAELKADPEYAEDFADAVVALAEAFDT